MEKCSVGGGLLRMIIKIKKHESSFVIIDKRPLENAVLSWRAKGLLAYLLTKPNNWVVVMNDLILRSRDKRQSTQKAFAELRDHGHATLETVRDELGRIVGKEWHIHEQARKIRPIHVREPLKDEEEAA
jgi:hypothetical protein